MGIGDRDNALGGLLFAVMALKELLDDTEGDGRFGGRAGLGDDDAGDIPLFGEVHQLGQILLGEVVSGKDDLGGVLAAQLSGEIVAERLDDAFGAEVAAADADADDKVHPLGLPGVPDGLTVGDHAGGRLRRKMFPSQEIIAGAVLGIQDIKGLEGFIQVLVEQGFIGEALAVFYIYFDHGINCLYYLSGGTRTRSALSRRPSGNRGP